MEKPLSNRPLKNHDFLLLVLPMTQKSTIRKGVYTIVSKIILEPHLKAQLKQQYIIQ